MVHSHQLVDYAKLTKAENEPIRGTGAEPDTGDGVGMLLGHAR